MKILMKCSQPVLEVQHRLHLPGILCQSAFPPQTTTWSRCSLQARITVLLEHIPGYRVEELPEETHR